jgi:hypothetical protein
VLELGEDLLDRIEVWAVGWQEQQAHASGPDRVSDSGFLVAGQVVEDDDVAGRERGAERERFSRSCIPSLRGLINQQKDANQARRKSTTLNYISSVKSRTDPEILMLDPLNSGISA